MRRIDRNIVDRAMQELGVGPPLDVERIRREHGAQFDQPVDLLVIFDLADANRVGHDDKWPHQALRRAPQAADLVTNLARPGRTLVDRDAGEVERNADQEDEEQHQKEFESRAAHQASERGEHGGPLRRLAVFGRFGLETAYGTPGGAGLARRAALSSFRHVRTPLERRKRVLAPTIGKAPRRGIFRLPTGAWCGSP